MNTRIKTILIVLAIIGIPLALYTSQNIGLMTATGPGFNVLSIQEIDYMSNIDRFTGSAIQVTATLTGDQTIRAGTIKEEQIEQYSDRFAESDLHIKQQITEETCNYNIKNTQKPIYKYNQLLKKPSELNFRNDRTDVAWRNVDHPVVYIKGEEDFRLGKNVADQMTDINIENIVAYIENAHWQGYFEGNWGFEGWVIDEAYIITRNQVAVQGQVEKPAQPLTWKSQIQVINPNGDTQKLNLSSNKNTALTDSVYIESTKGTLDNGNCPDVYDHDLGAVYQNKEWKITSRQSITDYQNLKQTEPQTTLKNQYIDIWNQYKNGETPSYVPYPDIDNRLNTLADQATAKKQIGTVNENTVNNVITQGTKQGGNLQLQMNRYLAIPLVKIMIDANWAGVYKPVSKPEITIQNPEINTKSGEPFSQTATIKNNGKVEDQFTITTTCEGPIAPTQRAPFYVTLSPQETTTRTINYIGNTPEDTSTSCTVKASSEQYKDTAKFNVNLETIPNPEPDCGNGKCEYGENYTNCPSDCDEPDEPDDVVCGDGVCEGNENKQNCPSDCGEPSKLPLLQILGIILITGAIGTILLYKAKTGRWIW